VLFFAAAGYGELCEEIRAAVGGRPGEIDRRVFTDGEVYHRIRTDVSGRAAVLVGGTIDDVATLELFDLACGLVARGAHSLTLVAPYLGYSTMDREVRSGEIVKAKTRARLLSSIPHAREANRLVLLDLHAEGIQYYFEGALQADHVYGKPVILEAVRELGREDFVLACTDAGRAKWVESLANEMQTPASFIFKRRLEDGRPVVTAMHADVAGRAVVIYDDMIRTGESLLNAAQAYRQAGARSIACVATHGLFPADALAAIRQSGLIERLICTNSHPRAVELARASGGYLEIRSVGRLLADAVRRCGDAGGE